MAELDVAIAGREAKDTIANLMQLYTHDFSEQWSGTSRGELGHDGRFPPYPLDPYWRDADRVPLLLTVDGRPVGFALINGNSHSGRPVDRNVAEFFIVRKHRRSGFGTAAAHKIFSRYPGRWEAAVARANVSALAFWRSAIGRHPMVQEIEESDHATALWNGPILRFAIRAA